MKTSTLLMIAGGAAAAYYLLGLSLTWIILIVAGIVFLQHINGKLGFFGARSTNKTVGQVGALVVGALIVGAFIPSLPVVGGVIDKPNLELGSQSVAGTETTTSGGIPITTLSWGVREDGTNSQTAYNGAIQIFEAGVDPSSSTATAFDTITLLNGVGSSTNGKVKTNTPYRVVATNATGASWYDIDYGTVTFSSANFNENTGALSYYDTAKPAVIVATIADPLNENSTTGDMNGQTTHSLGVDEIGCAAGCADDEEFLYDESVGDAQWYLDMTFAASGANAQAKNMVLKFVHDLTNPPEGDEFSSITASLRTGADLGIPSDITNNWKNQIPIDLGDMKAGSSSTYRLTFNVVEANEDGNDDWTIRVDDLGDFLGKDVRFSTRATAQTVTYGGSQA